MTHAPNFQHANPHNRRGLPPPYLQVPWHFCSPTFKMVLLTTLVSTLGHSRSEELTPSNICYRGGWFGDHPVIDSFEKAICINQDNINIQEVMQCYYSDKGYSYDDTGMNCVKIVT
jgi:hypothetical protein